MEIIAISSIVGIVAFAIGIFCGKVSPCCHDIYPLYPDSTLYPFYKTDLETRISRLERENQELRNTRYIGVDYGYTRPITTATIWERKFYAETPKEQEIADLLKENFKTTEKLAKKLKIEIN